MIKLKSLIKENKQPIIGYHGTGSIFNKFDLNKSTQGLIWFTSDKNKILKGEAGANGKGYIITAELNIKNPVGWTEYEKLLLAQLKSMGVDGAILSSGDNHYDYFVFSPKQIKIIKIEKV